MNDDSLPAGWANVRMGELFTDKQMDLFATELNKGNLTQTRIREIIEMDVSKMEGKADPRFMEYALMHAFNVRC